MSLRSVYGYLAWQVVQLVAGAVSVAALGVVLWWLVRW